VEQTASGIRVPSSPPLDGVKVRELIRRAQSGDTAARDELVERNLKLVLSVVRRFHGRAEHDDLFQVGCLGLIKAVMNFDLSFDVAFSTYAVPRIIGELRRHLRDDQPIKVGRNLREVGQAAQGARDLLEQRLGRPPTVDEIAQDVGVDVQTVIMALESQSRPASLDQPVDVGDGSHVYLKDQVAHEDDSEKPVISLALMQILAKLPPDERRLVEIRFIQGWTQVSAAKQLGCSQAHISRMERRAIERLRRLWHG